MLRIGAEEDRADWEDDLLTRAQLKQRWGHGSDSTFWRLEVDGLLIPKRSGRAIGYLWREVWSFEGGQPPVGWESA